MSTFFQDDDDSDQERSNTQQLRLENILADAGPMLSVQKSNTETAPKYFAQSDEGAVQNKDNGAVLESKDDTSEIFSEEKELEQLRKHSRYRRYVAEIRKDIDEGLPSQKRRRVEEVEESKAMQPVDSGPFREIDMKNKLPLTAPPKGDNIPIANVVKSAPSKRKIDPKILDDSSDEDSAEGSSSEDEGLLGPQLPMHLRKKSSSVSIDHLPVHNEALLGDQHDSFVSCLALDKAGNRLISGSFDSSAKFWDFHTMTRSLMPFRALNPLDESPLRHLNYSNTGGLLLCSGGSNYAVVMNREGQVISQTGTGDRYIVDASRTKGHTGAILCATWKPADTASSVVVTASADATVRVWDVTKTNRNPMLNHPVVTQQRVSKIRNSRGAKLVASAMDWCPDGKTLVLGCSDGQLRIMDPSSSYFKSLDESAAFLSGGEEITSVSCAPKSCAAPLVLVRSSDDYLRVFDRRRMQQPVHEFGDLPNTVSETNCCFIGENGDHFITGTSANRRGGTARGTIQMFARNQMKKVWKSEMDESSGSVVCSLWHNALNQIMFGTGDGSVHILYHPTTSKNGVLNCLSRSDYKKTHGVVSIGFEDAVPGSDLHVRGGAVINSKNASQQGTSGYRSKKERAKAMVPKPYTGPNVAKLNASMTLAKHLAAKDVSKDWSQDPREAILQYAKVAKRDPQFTKAYEITQPETILAEKTAEQEEDETRNALYERDRLRQLREKKK